MNAPTAKQLSAWQTCRVCGCYELAACDVGCSWVEPDLCSACEGRPAQLRDALDELASAAAAVVELQNVSAILNANRHEPYADWWIFYVQQATPPVLHRHADAAIRAQQLLDETRWPAAFDLIDPKGE